jgi:hypothetical protein
MILVRNRLFNNINKIMYNKTVDDNESISTKISQSKVVSYLSSSKQQMYQNKLSLQDKRVEM